jgi:TolB protein
LVARRQQQLTQLGSCWFPQFYPDGSRLAFHVERDIHVLNVKDSSITRLTNDPANGMYPSWSPDGTRIAFMSWRTGKVEIHVMDADGGNQKKLSHGMAGNAIDPAGRRTAARSSLCKYEKTKHKLGPSAFAS